nr:hypothetical protein B0A51_12553 [Rachicladosporium sp. CCFEE 5018]
MASPIPPGAILQTSATLALMHDQRAQQAASAIAHNTTSAPRSFKLPTEVRIEIYTLCVTADSSCAILDIGLLPNLLKYHPPPMGLLLASRAFHNDSFPHIRQATSELRSARRYFLRPNTMYYLKSSASPFSYIPIAAKLGRFLQITSLKVSFVFKPHVDRPKVTLEISAPAPDKVFRVTTIAGCEYEGCLISHCKASTRHDTFIKCVEWWIGEAVISRGPLVDKGNIDVEVVFACSSDYGGCFSDSEETMNVNLFMMLTLW